MSENLKIKLCDAFGNPYYRDLLPREDVEKILENLDIEEVVQMAYGAYCSNLARGECQLNLETGKLVNANYTQGSGDIQGMHYLTLYVVPGNLDLPSDDLYAPEEFKEASDLDIDMNEYVEMKGIDIEERELEALIEYAYDEIHSDEWWDEINTHLNDVYGE